ncbi:MAG TPA: exodeoxyribonuclease III, partial [Desulfurivibrionaceae bacterium]|nr:exodeoxyribonuclease III [Desulfurivibrionaceae bacterium]
MRNTFDIDAVLARLAEAVRELRVPVVDLIAVQTHDPYRVLVATILSARTKDETTAKAAARLFAQAADFAALERLGAERIATLIHPVGFFQTKAQHLARLPGFLRERFDGVIPQTVEELCELPGVGRKTANLVVAVAFKRPAICVDTHVHRIMNIWGYVATKTPLATEMALREKLPPRWWLTVNSIVVAFGQGICLPVRPHCDVCPVVAWCPQLGVTPRQPPGQREAARKGRAAQGVRRFVSWNVNGLRAAAAKGFAATVAELAPDILALQEVKATPEQLPETIRQPEGYRAFWLPAEKKGYAGVGIYAREAPLAVHAGMGVAEYDREGRVLTLEYPDFYFVNAYFPNAQHGLTRLDYKLAFDAAFLAYVQQLAAQKTTVVCGDFNVAHREIDLANPKENEKNAGFTPEERAWMDGFLAAGFVDTFRRFEPGG